MVGFMKGFKFVNLFRRYISRIESEWNKETTTVDVEIQDNTGPYGTPNTKMTIGPFEDKMPPGLSERDQYQFLMYVLFKDNRFRTQSGEYIAKIGGSITVLNKVKMKDIRMGSTRPISALVNRCNNNKKIQQNDGTCVQDYICEACKGEDGFERYSKGSLTADINKYVEDDEGKKPSTKEIINWQNNSHTNVSIYALGPFYKTFMASPARRKNGETVRLYFICKDNHCYSILNQYLNSKIT